MIKKINRTSPGPMLLFSIILLLFFGGSSCGNQSGEKTEGKSSGFLNKLTEDDSDDVAGEGVNALLISPKNPRPGEVFHILATGGKGVLKAPISVRGVSGSIESRKSRNGNGLPYWKIDEFVAGSEGKYEVTLQIDNKKVKNLTFGVISRPSLPGSKAIWQNELSWGAETEALYSAWINALFYDADESASWTSLHSVMQNSERNFLYNHLSLDEDNPAGKSRIIMQPDCADNPFCLRAYFAWKMGLPFGYHECDRGALGRNPKTGRWITNDSPSSKTNPVLAFNSFLRRVMDGVHSGTARTALRDENSDYYPVPLTRSALLPGVVFADPYGHTLTLVKWIPQSEGKPGTLLSVDAQPDGTVAIKRFWKGNFLFTTTGVIGEPGFKAFRPIIRKGGQSILLTNSEISADSGLTGFSLQQKGLNGDSFYHIMDRNINPKPLDPETALLDLVQALYEQLLVRITSVNVGENYMKSHPGAIVPMPSSAAGVFQTGGQWEDFSTPNRDLRLLIAMDAVLDFPDKVLRSPEDFKMPILQSPEKVKKNLEALLSRKLSELSITYTRTNGSEQKLTIADILLRREAFEIGYNPNDGIEIRWGAPENSEERSTCHRHVPPGQMQTMRSVRTWFSKRLHPPT